MLEEIFMMIPGKAFAGLSVMTVADLSNYPQLEEKLYFHIFLTKIV